MAANDPQPLSRERVEAIHAEHGRLKELLSELGRVSDVAELVPLLTRLKEALVEHFATEEAPDGMTAAVSQQPQFLPRVEEIFVEHEEFLRDLDDITERAKLFAEGPKAVFRDVAELAKRLHEHEARETEILTDATYTDLGGGA